MFTTGEKIWILSIMLYLIWALIGFHLEIGLEVISIWGSFGMIIFILLFNFIRLIKITNNGKNK